MSFSRLHDHWVACSLGLGGMWKVADRHLEAVNKIVYRQREQHNWLIYWNAHQRKTSFSLTQIWNCLYYLDVGLFGLGL